MHLGYPHLPEGLLRSAQEFDPEQARTQNLLSDPRRPSIQATPSLLNRIGTYASTIPRRVSDFAQGAIYGTGAGALRVGQGLLPKEQPRMAAMEQWGQEQVPDSPEGQAGGLLGSIAPEFTIAGDIADLARVPDYLKEREWVSGGLAALAAVPVVGTPVAKGIDAMRGADVATDLERTRDVGKVRDRHPDGTYVGAPQYQGTKRMDTPRRLEGMQQTYLDRVLKGIGGREWYADSSRWIDDAAAPGRRELTAKQLAITSQGTAVDPNLGHTIKAQGELATGRPVTAGRFRNTQGPLLETLEQNPSTYVGPKREPFATNLRVTADPKAADTAVHDIWQGRAFGYEHISTKGFDSKAAARKSITNEKGDVVGRVFKDTDGKWKTAEPWDAGFSPQQHAFMDEQMDEVIKYLNDNQVGGFTDWNHSNTQAAAWTGIQVETGRIRPEDAATHYGDLAQKYRAYTQPGGEEYYQAGGLLQDTRRTPGATSPLVQSAAATPKKDLLTAPVVQEIGGVIPSGREVLDTVEGGRAYISGADVGDWHRVIPDTHTTGAARKSGIVIPLEGPATAEQLERIGELAQAHGMKVFDTGTGINVMPDLTRTGDEAAVGGSALLNKLKGDMGTEIRSIFKEVNPIQTGDIKVADRDPRAILRVEIEQPTHRLAQAGDGRRTVELLDETLSNPTTREWMEPELIRDAERTLNEGAITDPTHLRALKILSSKGLQGLRDAIANGVVLPSVAVLGALGIRHMAPQDNRPSTGLLSS